MVGVVVGVVEAAALVRGSMLVAGDDGSDANKDTEDAGDRGDAGCCLNRSALVPVPVLLLVPFLLLAVPLSL